MGSRSDLRTRGIIDRILCDTLRQNLTCPLEFLWASHVFPGQGLRVWAGCRSSAGRHPLPEEPLSPTAMRICCPWESPSSLCDWPIISSPPDTALWMFLINYSHSLHSLTEQTRLGCIGEGNGNPLQYSCLENPRDGGAWLASIYGIAQSRTRLKWHSSSSSSIHL